MMKLLTVEIFLVLAARSAFATKTIFPDGFSFGASTAAYQIEGAWNENGRGECIWDRYIQNNRSRISHNYTAEVACDSYHKYKEDVQLAVALKLNHYRFSISWSRVLPTGFNNKLNLAGIAYYQKLIFELERYNITPMVTIYHWDLPQSLQDLGGWTNPNIVGYFKDYAQVVFSYFPTVKYWITINEPKQVCLLGYGYGTMAPGLNESGISDYRCAYHVAKAHAAVYHLYQDEFSFLGGKLSMAMDGSWNEPVSDSDNDVKAAERKRLFDFGLYAHPIFHGDWPKEVKERVAYRSKMENFTETRLPQFSDEEKKSIVNTVDFMALNYYNIHKVADVEEYPADSYSYNIDTKLSITTDTSWSHDAHLNAYVPNGFRKFLKWAKDTYNNPEIIITENGYADEGTLEDTKRITFLQDYLKSLLEAIYEDGVNVTAYTFWSLLDNFEWNNGYDHRFGLYQVNFNDANRTRTPKKSASYYRKIIENNGLPNGATTNFICSNILLILTAIFLNYY